MPAQLAASGNQDALTVANHRETRCHDAITGRHTTQNLDTRLCQFTQRHRLSVNQCLSWHFGRQRHINECPGRVPDHCSDRQHHAAKCS